MIVMWTCREIDTSAVHCIRPSAFNIGPGILMVNIWKYCEEVFSDYVAQVRWKAGSGWGCYFDKYIEGIMPDKYQQNCWFTGD